MMWDTLKVNLNGKGTYVKLPFKYKNHIFLKTIPCLGIYTRYTQDIYISAKDLSTNVCVFFEILFGIIQSGEQPKFLPVK